MLDNKDPFGYPVSTYLWVFGLALIGGAVKYLNHSDKFSFIVLIRDLVTAGFAGLLTFWLCEWTNISGPLSAVLIATAGLMGTRALKEIENLYRLRMGLPLEKEEAPSLPTNDGAKREGE
jgi:CHASE2 domain-containing sensor protein